MREDNPPPIIGLASPPHRGGRALATVLVVDDNKASLELARIMLEQHSKLRCELHYADGAEDALAFLRTRAATEAPVDLLLLDINMPRVDGFEVLAQIHAEELMPWSGVVMCSTSSYDRDVERAYALGACGYLEKPPGLQALRPLLARLDHLVIDEDEAGVFLLRAAPILEAHHGGTSEFSDRFGAASDP